LYANARQTVWGIAVLVVAGIAVALYASSDFGGGRKRDAGLAQPPNSQDCKEGKLPERIVAGCTMIIDGGSLSGKDLADIYELRGDAFLELRQFARALADWDQLYRVLPIPTVYLKRANLYMKVAQFDEAGLQLDQGLRRIQQLQASLSSPELEASLKQLNDDIASAQDRLTLLRSVEPMWVAYLKEIQMSGPATYSNWSGPPYEAYEKYRKLQ
jgi:tetratricopeptide (TPR) repeat protein